MFLALYFMIWVQHCLCMCQHYHGEELSRVVMVIIMQIIVYPCYSQAWFLSVTIMIHFYMFYLLPSV
jgi:hypothetical protein